MSRGSAVGAAVLVVGLVWWQLALSWKTCKHRARRRAMEADLRYYVGGSQLLAELRDAPRDLVGLQAIWRASDFYRRDSFASEDEKAPPRDVVAWWLDPDPPQRRAVDPALEAELDRALSDRHHHRRGRFPTATGELEERSFTHTHAGGDALHWHDGLITDEEALGPEPEAEGGQASGGTPGPQAPDPATSGRAGGPR